MNRRYRWASGEAGVCPADAALGIDEQRISLGARQMCCVMGMNENFKQAAADLRKLAGLSLSKEKLRQVVEAEAVRVRTLRDSGSLPASWSASEAKLPNGKTRTYVGVDGVMAPTVTQAEKDKRRQQHVTRRQQRGKAGLDNARPLPQPRAGTDEKFKEMKIGVFYDQARERRHVFATEETSKDFAPLLAAHARLIGLENAQETLGRVDGAVWIYQQVCLALVFISSILLDFYHLAEHVHASARCCLGDGTPAALAWAGEVLAQARKSDVAEMLGSIGEFEKRVRSEKKKESLRTLRHYIEQRRDMLDYAEALRQGQDIGSGPTEAECKTLTMRLKGPGMKWDRDHAAGMMNLIALRESGQSETYWQRPAA